MDKLWSASTTMRNPERTYSFLQTIREIDGKEWTNETQMKLQALLIKNRFYTPTKENLSDEQIAILENLTYDMTYDEAVGIFNSKKYEDPPMRGRVSFDPIEKLGLVMLTTNNQNKPTIQVTAFGKMFLDGDIDLNEVVFTNLLKYQFPNPLSNDRKDYNIKPFICILRLIKKVNELCADDKAKVKGISKEEFGIFALSIKSYLEIDSIARALLQFRAEKNRRGTFDEKQTYTNDFIKKYLRNFQRPEKNIYEYADNIIRYIRLTKYIYIRGGGYYIDLEPRRMVEIDAILDSDNGSAGQFTKEEYMAYISDYKAYKLPFETEQALKSIAKNIISEINQLELQLEIGKNVVILDEDIASLKIQISQLREQRAALQNIRLKKEYQEIIKIDEAIDALNNIRALGMKPSIALEKWTNIALNIINDAVLIKPNAPHGDDNEPTFTAPSGVADIECYYNSFAAICEVTMLTSRDQWFNEGQPVMRHLRSFETTNTEVDNYCLFVAPTLHTDTLNTFWTAVKYEYQGAKQRIVPITINQLITILQTIKSIKKNRKVFSHDFMKELYDNCIEISGVKDSTLWSEHIGKAIQDWDTKIAG